MSKESKEKQWSFDTYYIKVGLAIVCGIAIVCIIIFKVVEGIQFDNLPETVDIRGVRYKIDKENREAYVVGLDSMHVEHLVIPETVRFEGVNNYVVKICRIAFRDRNDIQRVTLANSIGEIGTCAFYKCSSLKSFNIPGRLERIGSEAFAYTQLRSVFILPYVGEVGENAFSCCDSLTEFFIADGTDNLFINGSTGGRWCDIISRSSVKTFYLGRDCYTLGGGRNKTEYYNTFIGLPSLETLIIGKCVDDEFGSVFEGSFDECLKLKTIYCMGMPVPLNRKSFADCHYKNTIVYVPQGTKSQYVADDYWKKFLNINEYDVLTLPWDSLFTSEFSSGMIYSDEEIDAIVDSLTNKLGQ